MSWELNHTFVGQYRTELESALYKWSPEDLAIALANDDYSRNEREVSQKWFDGRKGYYFKFCALDTLVNTCIERIERTATTDNGACAIWIDKGGCSKIDSAELEDAA